MMFGQVLGHHGPLQLPAEDERQEGGLPDRDRVGVLGLHLLPRHRLVAPHSPGWALARPGVEWQ